MIKDLSAKLVAAVTEINQKSRQSFAAEQQEIAAKKAASAKMHTFMPKQPAPKADPAANSKAAKMAEEAEGTIPKTPREKELAAKSGNPKRITFGDVLKARGVHKEEVERLNEVHVLDDEGETHVHVKDAKNVRELDRAVAHHLIKHHGFSHQDVEDHYHDGYYSEAPYHHEKPEKGSKPTETRTKEEHAKSVAERVAQMKKDSEMDEGFMASMKKFGNKVLDTVAPSDEKLIDNLHKSVHGKNAPNVPKPKIKQKLAHDYVKEEKGEKGEKGETAAHEKAEKKKEVPEWKKMLNDPYRKEKSAFHSKQISTGTVYSRKYEEVESVAVNHGQYGAGKTLPQFAEDLSWVDVMFDEGIKRVNVEDLELVEEKAVHPDAIHVSNAGGGKYKVHAVGKNFSHGIKVGEHLTDTHLDDFSEMGGKIKTVKPPKKD